MPRRYANEPNSILYRIEASIRVYYYLFIKPSLKPTRQNLPWAVLKSYLYNNNHSNQKYWLKFLGAKLANKNENNWICWKNYKLLQSLLFQMSVVLESFSDLYKKWTFCIFFAFIHHCNILAFKTINGSKN